MLRDKKRKHHYVFQAYLKAWSKNDQIFCKRKQKIFKTNLINIAQERDFYKVSKLSAQELEFYKKMISNDSEEIQRLKLKYVSLFQTPYKWEEYFRFQKLILNDIIKKTPNQKKKELLELEEKISEIIETSKFNLMEDYYADIEGNSIFFLNSLKKSDFSFYYNEEIKNSLDKESSSRFQFIYFMCVQYFRTKNMRDRFVKSLKESLYKKPDLACQLFGKDWEMISIEKIYPLFMWDFQNACTEHLYKNNTHLTILLNKSIIPFITSDQPVINVEADYHNPNISTTDLVCFYPISPTVGVTLNDKNRTNVIYVEEKEVIDLNYKIAKASNEFIFGEKSSDLEQL